MEEKKGIEKNKQLKKKYNIKVILLGEVFTGKTSLINNFLGNEYNPEEKSTLNPSQTYTELEINNNKFCLSLWDTMGLEKFRSVTKSFIKDSNIVIFVYDITRRETFLELNFWVDTVKREIGNDEAIFGLAANKIDLINECTVENEEGVEYAHSIGALFSETSAEKKIGFSNLVNRLLEKFASNKKNPENIEIIREKIGSFHLDKNSNTKNKKKCAK